MSTLTEYAKRRGVSKAAVSKAIATGRLTKSVARNKRGQPSIADQDLADREWDANTRGSEEDGELPPGIPKLNVSRAIREHHAARREAALADSAEDERDFAREELVPTEEARAFVIDRFTVVKTKLTGVPTRLSQRLPELAEKVTPVLDQLIREALEELAVDFDEDGDDDQAVEAE